jgi:hypothetical protein
VKPRRCGLPSAKEAEGAWELFLLENRELFPHVRACVRVHLRNVAKSANLTAEEFAQPALRAEISAQVAQAEGALGTLFTEHGCGWHSAHPLMVAITRSLKVPASPTNLPESKVRMVLRALVLHAQAQVCRLYAVDNIMRVARKAEHAPVAWVFEGGEVERTLRDRFIPSLSEANRLKPEHVTRHLPNCLADIRSKINSPMTAALKLDLSARPRTAEAEAVAREGVRAAVSSINASADAAGGTPVPLMLKDMMKAMRSAVSGQVSSRPQPTREKPTLRCASREVAREKPTLRCASREVVLWRTPRVVLCDPVGSLAGKRDEQAREEEAKQYEAKRSGRLDAERDRRLRAAGIRRGATSSAADLAWEDETAWWAIEAALRRRESCRGSLPLLPLSFLLRPLTLGGEGGLEGSIALLDATLASLATVNFAEAAGTQEGLSEAQFDVFVNASFVAALAWAHQVGGRGTRAPEGSKLTWYRRYARNRIDLVLMAMTDEFVSQATTKGPHIISREKVENLEALLQAYTSLDEPEAVVVS